MDFSYYERHPGLDPELPLIFNRMGSAPPARPLEGHPGLHWHESLEILHFVSGTGHVICGLTAVPVQAGDTVVVGGSELHTLEAREGWLEWYYVIPDASLWENFSLELRDIAFRHLLPADQTTGRLIRKMEEELHRQAPGYKAAVKALLAQMMVYLCRNAVEDRQSLHQMKGDQAKLEIVKQALSYMQLHCAQPITLDELCGHVGLSRYYFCRVFRAVTGMTSVEYLNLYRCTKAQKLLKTGRFTIAGAAEAAGFTSLPYFYRIYRKAMNTLPSRDLPGTEPPAP